MKNSLSLLLLFLSFSVWAEFSFPKEFDFGLASAPAQSEDQLNDSWMLFGDSGNIPGFRNTIRPKDKLMFWSNPEVEISWLEKSNISLYRLGVDWQRIMPDKNKFDEKALDQYEALLKTLKEKQFKIMLTLVHHSLPIWVEKQGGWLHPETIRDFNQFSKKVYERFHPYVDFWITFNEPQIFAILSYQMGLWPPFEKRSFFANLDLGFLYRGAVIKALHFMSEAHTDFYNWAHEQNPLNKIGIAQHMGYHSGKTLINKLVSTFTGHFMNWDFPSRIEGKMDFFGINYYGAEWVNHFNITLEPDEEYSEAGRAVYPQGLYFLLQDIHDEYPSLPIMITENGFSDSTDQLRPSYMIEHLAAVHQAIEDGIPVQSYIWWTLSDNFEWSDGYCPKFGLLEVDRAQDLKRIPRESFFLFSEIAKEKTITDSMRKSSWKKVKASQGKPRPFCRAEDGIGALAIPRERKVVKKDWRFSF